jgi:hypothetical protein
MEILISDRTHKFQNKTGLNAKDNSELYKSKQVNSVGCPSKQVSIRNNRKLVSALSETKCLFRLFRLYTETESFQVSIEPKQTEDQPKQFDREDIKVFFL